MIIATVTPGVTSVFKAFGQMQLTVNLQWA